MSREIDACCAFVVAHLSAGQIKLDGSGRIETGCHDLLTWLVRLIEGGFLLKTTRDFRPQFPKCGAWGRKPNSLVAVYAGGLSGCQICCNFLRAGSCFTARSPQTWRASRIRFGPFRFECGRAAGLGDEQE